MHGAEADDVIATLVKEYPNEKIMIVSGDKDFIQLQKFSNVSQYSPILKKHVNGEDTSDYIRVHILKGEPSDGIPNVLSNDDSIVNGVRQKPITKKYIDNFVLHNAELNGRTDTEIRNYHRNEKLIDLKQTPKDIGDMIWREYTRSPQGSRKNLLNFFVEKRLNNLIESIGEFLYG